MDEPPSPTTIELTSDDRPAFHVESDGRTVYLTYVKQRDEPMRVRFWTLDEIAAQLGMAG